MKRPRYLFLTPPLVQTNAPYPTTMHLVGFLRAHGIAAEQRDLSIGVVRDVLLEYGGDEAEQLLELLSGDAPADAKVEASAWIEDLARRIRDEIDPAFGFSRYAARISANASDFGQVERQIRRRGVMDGFLERRLEQAIAETRPTAIGVTCPFPGTLVGAFKIAAWVKAHHPAIRLLLGGGFVSTELREMTDLRPRRYFDDFILDEGYRHFVPEGTPIPVFVEPSYEGISWDDYFDVVETANPMHRLWSVGRWIKLQMARGCYWHKCAFCDVHLPYIKCFEMPDAVRIVDAMERLGRHARGRAGFHFVDEAMPPALIRRVSEEIVRRRLAVSWWGNVRFDASFTPELCRLMARAGCIAVTGGLECANDRLLALMNKGITLESARQALEAFHAAGIMVHAYLMYGFPTETEAEAFGALGYVRDLFRADLVQSAFWHRFALTVHSPIARETDRFGIKPVRKRPRKRLFCRNEIPFTEPSAPDWTTIGRALDLALANYLEGRGLSKSMAFWKRAAQTPR